jgi:hypothetical protein
MRLEWRLAAMIGVLIWAFLTEANCGKECSSTGFTRRFQIPQQKGRSSISGDHEIIMNARVTVYMQSNMIHMHSHPGAGRAQGPQHNHATRPAWYL